MGRSGPDGALRVQVDVPDSLTGQVSTGALDVALMYAPQYRPGARVELLLEEKDLHSRSRRVGLFSTARAGTLCLKESYT